jgi:transposase-like protein
MALINLHYGNSKIALSCFLLFYIGYYRSYFYGIMANSTDKKQKAKALFLTGQYLQKEIAAIVGISEKTLSKWANDEKEKWEDLKVSMLTTRSNELRRLYKMLRIINDGLDEKSEMGLPINSKDADAVLKLTAAIKNLEIETSIAEKVEVGSEFINMIRKEDIELSKVITKWFDIYLNQFA